MVKDATALLKMGVKVLHFYMAWGTLMRSRLTSYLLVTSWVINEYYWLYLVNWSSCLKLLEWPFNLKAMLWGSLWNHLQRVYCNVVFFLPVIRQSVSFWAYRNQCFTPQKTHKWCNFPLAVMFPGVNLSPGQKVTAVILHIDILSSCIHVSILSKLVGKKKSVSIAFLNTALLFQNDNIDRHRHFLYCG